MSWDTIRETRVLCLTGDHICLCNKKNYCQVNRAQERFSTLSKLQKLCPDQLIASLQKLSFLVVFCYFSKFCPDVSEYIPTPLVTYPMKLYQKKNLSLHQFDSNFINLMSNGRPLQSKSVKFKVRIGFKIKIENSIMSAILELSSQSKRHHSFN